MSPDDASFVLQSYGFPLAAAEVFGTIEEAALAAHRIGGPVALKAVGATLIHKSDVGAVLLDLEGADRVLEAGKELIDKLAAKGLDGSIEGFMIQEMVKGGREVILGMAHDRSFGPLLMFGLGGKYVEIFNDVCFRVVPITDNEAREMLTSITGYPILAGARGEEPIDQDFLAECLERLSRLVETFEEIGEIDINPLVCFEPRESFRAVDARIRIRSQSELALDDN